MIGRDAAIDPRIKRTLRLLKEHPTLSLPQAMYLAKFSESESKDRAIQMRVRRHQPSQIPSLEYLLMRMKRQRGKRSCR
jgi:hypothetical protein